MYIVQQLIVACRVSRTHARGSDSMSLTVFETCSGCRTNRVCMCVLVPLHRYVNGRYTHVDALSLQLIVIETSIDFAPKYQRYMYGCNLIGFDHTVISPSVADYMCIAQQVVAI